MPYMATAHVHVRSQDWALLKPGSTLTAWEKIMGHNWRDRNQNLCLKPSKLTIQMIGRTKIYLQDDKNLD